MVSPYHHKSYGVESLFVRLCHRLFIVSSWAPEKTHLGDVSMIRVVREGGEKRKIFATIKILLEIPWNLRIKSSTRCYALAPSFLFDLCNYLPRWFRNVRCVMGRKAEKSFFPSLCDGGGDNNNDILGGKNIEFLPCHLPTARSLNAIKSSISHIHCARNVHAPRMERLLALRITCRFRFGRMYFRLNT